MDEWSKNIFLEHAWKNKKPRQPKADRGYECVFVSKL